jgi:hypothetical protein
MKKTAGYLNIKIYVDCPNCNERIDLLSSPYTDDGWIYELVMPKDGPWSGACDDFSKEYIDSFGEDFECEHCGKVIDVGNILYI